MPTNPNMLVSPKQRHGSYFEDLAVTFLKQQGLKILVQNWHQHNVGELDLVCIEPGRAWDILVFVEVRKRKQAGFGDALASITASKKRKMIKTARYFLQRHPQYANLECRFDVIGFNEPAKHAKKQDVHNELLIPEWVQGAFITSAW